MKNRLTLILIAIFCALWAIPIPGWDPIPVLVDDIVAAVGAAAAIVKLIQSKTQAA